MTAENTTTIRLGPRCGYCCMCPTAPISEIYTITGTATGPNPSPEPGSGCQCFCTCGWERYERSKQRSAPLKPLSLKTRPEPRKDWK